jgi:8-oxo-dGTP diphosphatase
MNDEVKCAKNTDRELWQATDSYYSPSIHATEGDGVGINVGGHVIVMPIEKWHQLGKQALKMAKEKPRHAVGVSILLVENGRLLLGRRKNSTAAGMLSTPGGRLELEESVLACAVREFFEETGAVLNSRLEVTDVQKFSRFGDHYIMFYVFATKHKGTIQNIEPDKCEGWNWYSGYDLAGRTDVTEPPEVLKLLPLTQTTK